jgi:hypothetical protein
MVQNLGPVNQEALGQETNAKSGVAIEQRQQQAQTSLYGLFDGRNLAQQREQEQTLSLVQDGYTEEKEIRITGSKRGLDYLNLNKHDPAQGLVINDISQGRYDIIVDEQPEAPTARAAKLQALAQLLANTDLPPAVRMQTVIAIAEGQDMPTKTLESLDEALKMLQQPQPQQEQAPRKSITEAVSIAMADLTPAERAQVLQQMGVQADPNGPPPVPTEGAPEPQQGVPLDPNKAMDLQTKQQMQAAQHAHEFNMAQADREHQMQQGAAQAQQQAAMSAEDRQHQMEMAAQGHDNSLEQQQQAADLAPPPPDNGGGSD